MYTTNLHTDVEVVQHGSNFQTDLREVHSSPPTQVSSGFCSPNQGNANRYFILSGTTFVWYPGSVWMCCKWPGVYSSGKVQVLASMFGDDQAEYVPAIVSQVRIDGGRKSFCIKSLLQTIMRSTPIYFTDIILEVPWTRVKEPTMSRLRDASPICMHGSSREVLVRQLFLVFSVVCGCFFFWCFPLTRQFVC